MRDGCEPSTPTNRAPGLGLQGLQEIEMSKIVWNGCDGYVEADLAAHRGYNFYDGKLYHGSQEFTAFDATEINPADLPKDEDGELDFNGVFGCESGKFYRETTVTHRRPNSMR